MVSFGQGYRYHVTGLAHDESGFPTNRASEIEKLLDRLHRKIEQNRDHIVEVDAFEMEDAEIGLISFGSSARASRHAVRLAREAGKKAGLLRIKTLWPFPDQEIRAYGDRVKKWIVAEMNRGQLVHEVEWALSGRAPVHRVTVYNGDPISPLIILDKINQLD